jgi:monoamine oxidase
VSDEAFALMTDAGSFRPQFQDWNAAEAFADLAASWPEGLRAFRVCDGYEALPREVAERVVRAGGKIETEHLVTGFDPAPDRLVRLELAGGGHVAARRVVLALGHRALAGLVPRTPLAGNATITSALEAVFAVPLFHVFLLYEHPWWADVGISGGRSSTDLPMQSCFYFGSETARSDAVPSILMIGYSAPASIDFWDRYGASLDDPAPTSAPVDMVAELTRQLSELHGTEVPTPAWSSRSDWRARPFGGASHRWAIGARSWDVVPALRRPDPQLAVHVCGEAWSDGQGWVEGALRSAERVARDELGLLAPAWSTRRAFLGP